MTEIAQLFESALKNNRASLLRKAAMNTVASMPGATTLRELLQSEACQAIRDLTLGDLWEALRQGSGLGEKTSARQVFASVAPAAREERMYVQILEALSAAPLTIGQLAKQLAIEVDELRGYLDWMRKQGKIFTQGTARATRYYVTRD